MFDKIKIVTPYFFLGVAIFAYLFSFQNGVVKIVENLSFDIFLSLSKYLFTFKFNLLTQQIFKFISLVIILLIQPLIYQKAYFKTLLLVTFGISNLLIISSDNLLFILVLIIFNSFIIAIYDLNINKFSKQKFFLDLMSNSLIIFSFLLIGRENYSISKILQYDLSGTSVLKYVVVLIYIALILKFITLSGIFSKNSKNNYLSSIAIIFLFGLLLKLMPLLNQYLYFKQIMLYSGIILFVISCFNLILNKFKFEEDFILLIISFSLLLISHFSKFALFSAFYLVSGYLLLNLVIKLSKLIICKFTKNLAKFASLIIKILILVFFGLPFFYGFSVQKLIITNFSGYHFSLILTMIFYSFAIANVLHLKLTSNNLNNKNNYFSLAYLLLFILGFFLFVLNGFNLVGNIEQIATNMSQNNIDLIKLNRIPDIWQILFQIISFSLGFLLTLITRVKRISIKFKLLNITLFSINKYQSFLYHYMESKKLYLLYLIVILSLLLFIELNYIYFLNLINITQSHLSEIIIFNINIAGFWLISVLLLFNQFNKHINMRIIIQSLFLIFLISLINKNYYLWFLFFLMFNSFLFINYNIKNTINVDDYNYRISFWFKVINSFIMSLITLIFVLSSLGLDNIRDVEQTYGNFISQKKINWYFAYNLVNYQDFYLLISVIFIALIFINSKIENQKLIRYSLLSKIQLILSNIFKDQKIKKLVVALILLQLIYCLVFYNNLRIIISILIFTYLIYLIINRMKMFKKYLLNYSLAIIYYLLIIAIIIFFISFILMSGYEGAYIFLGYLYIFCLTLLLLFLGL